ncbi:MAG: ABC transporter ATP-binding protein [Candidatus Caldarchaeum sp.]
MLRVENLISGYRNIEVLHGVSISTEYPITAVIGPNGAGKSTLLKTIYGLLRPLSGRITFRGNDITSLPTPRLIRLGIAYLRQNRAVFPYLTVEENLRIGVWSLRKDKDRVEKAVSYVYDSFPFLRKKRDVRAGSLSGGEQRILEFARVMMTDPSLVLLDEFSVGVAPKVYAEISKLIKRYADENKVRFLMVDQNLRQALVMSDYVYVLKAGLNMTEGPAQEIRRKLDEIVANWLK